MQIDTSDIDDAPTSQTRPCLGHPRLRHEAIEQDVEVRVSVLLILECPDVLRGTSEASAQIHSEVGKDLVDVASGVFPPQLLWVKSKSEESGHLVLLCYLSHADSVTLGFARTTCGAPPTLAADVAEARVCGTRY